MMKKIILLAVTVCCLLSKVKAQTNASFYVGGDLDKYYPVIFSDAGWHLGKATEIEIGRSDTHTDAMWRGSLIAKFRFHATMYGNGSNFIDADIKSTQNFIAGWHDATNANSNHEIIIWIRGGNSYHLNSMSTVAYRIYDGTQYALPFNEQNGPSHTYKNTIESYVMNYAQMIGNSLRVGGDLLAFGNVGIGVANPQERLAVNGNIRAKEVRVEASNWPDYVYEDGYQVETLEKLESYIKEHKHLPEVPSAKEVEKDGIAVGEMNKILLKKIEELTLHLIEKDNQVNSQSKLIKQLQSDMKLVKASLKL